MSKELMHCQTDVKHFPKTQAGNKWKRKINQALRWPRFARKTA